MKKIVFLCYIAFFSLLDIKSQNVIFEQLLPEPPESSMQGDFMPKEGNAIFGDVDNDGDMDLLVTGQDPRSISAPILYINNGFGHFNIDENNSFNNISKSSSIFGDFDNDGDLDLILAGYTIYGNQVHIYTNTGNGIFSSTPVILNIWTQYGSLDSGDFDNDGDLDLLISKDAKLLKNNGNFNFTLEPNLFTEALSNALAAFIDYDQDGDLDIYYTGINSNNVEAYFYINDGLGNYNSAPFNIGVNNGNAKVKDIDADGDQDICVVGQTNNGHKGYYLMNNGSGNFSSRQIFDSLENAYFDLTDFDSDSDLDIIVSGYNFNRNAPQTICYRNDSAIFTVTNPNTFYDLYYYGNVTFSDMDIDGDQDVLLVGRNDNFIQKSAYYSNDGNGNFNRVKRSPFVGLTGTASDYADVDSDGDIDFMISGQNEVGQNQLILYLNNGGKFIPDTNLIYEIAGGSISFGDIDGDLDQDVLLSGSSNGVLKTVLLTNNGTGIFSELTGTTFPGTYTGYSDFFDVDNDGDLDILITGRGINTTIYSSLFINDGTGNYTEKVNNGLLPLYDCDFSTGDIDGDGDQDIVMIGSSFNAPYEKSYKCINDGTGNFSVENNAFINGVSGSIELGDVDNDGDLDVFCCGSVSPTLAFLYINDGGGGLTPSQNQSFIGNAKGDAEFSDLDGDGDLDLIYSGELMPNYGQTLTYFNDGNGVFTKIDLNVFPNVYYSRTQVFDANNDGKKDIFISGWEEGNEPISRLYMNMECATEYYVDNITYCSSYTWYNGITYNSSTNTPRDTLIDINGCVIYKRLNLQIQPSNIDIAINNGSLVTQQFGTDYQWIDCDSGIAITGAIQSSYLPANNGNYALQMNYQGCIDTSSCISYNETYITELNTQNQIKVYPNPSSGDFYIDMPNSNTFNLEIFNQQGQLIYKSITNKKIHLDISNGLYLGRAFNENQIKYFKIKITK